MRKWIVWVALVSGTPLFAQQTGEEAVNAAKAGSESNWQNWAFAGSALVTAAAGVFVISINNGHNATGH